MVVNEILSKVTRIDDKLAILELTNNYGIAIEDTVFAAVGHLDGELAIGNAMTLNSRRGHFKPKSYSKIADYAKEMPDPASNPNMELKDLYKTILDPLIIRPKYISVDGVVHVKMRITNKHILDSIPQGYSVAVDGTGFCPDSFGDWTSRNASRWNLQAILPNGIVLEEGRYSDEGTQKYHQANYFLYAGKHLIDAVTMQKEKKDNVYANWCRFQDNLDCSDVSHFMNLYK